MRILCIGQEWRGSNSSGLFYALSRQGCLTYVVNEQWFISSAATSHFLKGFHLLIRPLQIRDFNVALKKQFDAFMPHLVLIYKGAYILPETIISWQQKGVPVIVFYPDVSFMAHGKYIPLCLPLYDHIFTTKTFAALDLSTHFNIRADKISFIPHGFDPCLHRPLKNIPENFRCQASFIGNYSPWKAHVLEELMINIPDLNLKVWGATWKYYKGKILNSSIQGQALLGDAYVAAINASKINLAILSERVHGASSGDLITSRTFHIPGSGGFMLHEKNIESIQYFEDGKEAVFFADHSEMVEKVRYYLIHNTEREAIAQKGKERADHEHSLDKRAQRILHILHLKKITNTK